MSHPQNQQPDIPKPHKDREEGKNGQSYLESSQTRPRMTSRSVKRVLLWGLLFCLMSTATATLSITAYLYWSSLSEQEGIYLEKRYRFGYVRTTSLSTNNSGNQKSDTSRKEPLFINLPQKSITDNFLEMHKDGILSHPNLVLTLLKITGWDRKIRSGVYEFNSRMSTITILKQLFEGRVKLVKVTIVEGYDLYDLADLFLRMEFISDKKDFIHWTGGTIARRLALTPLATVFPSWKSGLSRIPNVEGFLYPDTYLVSLVNPVEQVFQLAGKNFLEKNLSTFQEFEKRDKGRNGQKSQSDFNHWLKVFTISSLIEKETHLLKEKPLVSSVIYNRLQQKMKLRIDPTVIYTLKKLNLVEENQKDGFINIKRSHYSLPSPYNTYYTRRLPPGPISSFNDSSLQAALKPKETNYLFFVAKKKNSISSGHYFSHTYEEHLRYVRQLLKNKN